MTFGKNWEPNHREAWDSGREMTATVDNGRLSEERSIWLYTFHYPEHGVHREFRVAEARDVMTVFVKEAVQFSEAGDGYRVDDTEIKPVRDELFKMLVDGYSDGRFNEIYTSDREWYAKLKMKAGKKLELGE